MILSRRTPNHPSILVMTMKIYLKIISVSFTAFLLPTILYSGYLFFLIKSCDPKFGCAGSFQLSVLIASVFSIVSMFALAASIFTSNKKLLSWPVVASSCILGSIYEPIILISGSDYLNSETSRVITWLCISFFVYMGALWLSKK